jgi:hypothetical protein
LPTLLDLTSLPYLAQGVKIPINIDGRFFIQHGQIGGTDCPTDGYTMSGQFISNGEALGTIRYSTDCKYVSLDVQIPKI